MSKVDEIIYELSSGINELKSFVQVADQYSCYVETDLSNFEVVKAKYIFKNKKGRSRQGSSKRNSPRFLRRQSSKKLDVA
jgi:hypothetical protein